MFWGGGGGGGDIYCRWHILKEDVHYLNTSLTGKWVLLVRKSYRRACITEGHVLEEDLPYWMAYCVVHVVLENMFYWRTVFTSKFFL